MCKNDKKFMFSKLPNQPEISQISDSVSKKYLTARLTLNGFDTAQHTVWETSAYCCYWVLILEPILLNFKINVLVMLTSDGAFFLWMCKFIGLWIFVAWEGQKFDLIP